MSAIAMNSTTRSAVALFVWAALALGCDCGATAPAPAAEEATTAAARPLPEAIGWVGAERCGECHSDELSHWRGSHHDRSLDPPDEATVVGDFDGRSSEHGGVTSTFSRRGSDFRVHTDGSDGELADFDIAYSVGVTPLQQYLIAGERGRLQSLSLLWDARPDSEGGQRWYHLYGDDVAGSDDPLHWTRPAQNYNYVCADCHSTGLHRGYDASTDSYETTWAEIDVACEACHGPGEAHVDWAENETPYPNHGLRSTLSASEPWVLDPETGSARPHPRDDRLIETCAPCHSRREPIADDPRAGDAFLDFFMPELLTPGLYQADGQILDEVYVWGSFTQSRMHEAGVRCNDCHEPHSLSLRAEGNNLCAQCHDARRFDVPSHHHHESETEGAACVSCHMPDRVYMGVDARRDHSLRVPRPDLAARFGTPEPCTRCHEDRDAAWAATAVAGWTGSAPAPHFSDALVLGHAGLPGSFEALVALAADDSIPAIVRATALEMLASHQRRELFTMLQPLARSREPLVRYGVTRAAGAFAPALRIALLSPMADDPIRAVRIGVARALSDVDLDAVPAPHRANVSDAFSTYRQANAVSASRPQAQVERGAFEIDRGDLVAAERAYRRALELESDYAPARLNLADLHRLRGEEAEAEAQLRALLEEHPEHADAHHALGLLLIRKGAAPEAVGQLGRASELRPNSARFVYVHAVALASSGARAEAIRILVRASARHPADADLGIALASYQQEAGNVESARRTISRVLAVHPQHPAARQMSERLR